MNQWKMCEMFPFLTTWFGVVNIFIQNLLLLLSGVHSINVRAQMRYSQSVRFQKQCIHILFDISETIDIDITNAVFCFVANIG